MKVSAPLVPPPVTETPATIDPAAPGVADTAASDPAAPPSLAMAKWPEWFKPVDLALAILVAVLAFLLASYTARNPDLWRHLGTGRLIAHGQHPIGGDPLTYTGADRAWVNSDWMFDVLMYAAFSADDTGTLVVVLKALVFATAFALLFLLRKPDQALWPWALVAALGVVATGTLASLRPFVFGMLLQSILLVLVYRGNWSGPRWRMPAIVGGVCWIWACTDSFFFLGPLTIALVWAGEKLHKSFVPGPAETAGEDSFWSAPPAPALQRALLLSVAGALLNPMFLGALVRSPLDALAQLLPFELTLGWADLFAGDPHLTPIVLSPLNAAYLDATERGDSVPAYSALALVVCGGLLLGAGLSRLRTTHILFWFAFVVLALLHYRFIPAAAIMAVPLAAGHLNGLSRFRLQSVSDPSTKTILTLSGVGRIVSVALLLALIAATIPGYLHARSTYNAVVNRRVSWGIEEEVGLSRGAKLLQQWRADKSLPPESHGLLSFYDLGDYCAWFAPDEKPFVDSRFRFHTPELIDLATIRRELRRGPTEAEGAHPESSGALKSIADQRHADYFVVGQWNQPVPVAQLFRVESEFTDVNQRRNTVLLHLDGRVLILCRTDTKTGQEISQNIPYSPQSEAFSSRVVPVPSGKSEQPPEPTEGWLADFLARPQSASIASDDAMLFAALGKSANVQAEQLWNDIHRRAELAGYGAGPAIQYALDGGPRMPEPPELAYAILAMRAARRAITETSDDPTPYHALAEAYALRYTGTLDPKEAELQRITSLRRFLDRVPAAPNGNERFAKAAVDDELSLFLLHLATGQMDSALDLLSKANARIKSAPEGALPSAERMKSVIDSYRLRTLELRFGLPSGVLEGQLYGGDLGLAPGIASYLVRQEMARGAPAPSNEQAVQMLKEIGAIVAGTTLDAKEKPDKSKPRDAAWVRSQAQSLEDRLKGDMGKRNESYAQAAKGAGLAQKFVLAVQNGLVGRAIELVSTQADWETLPATELIIPIEGAGSLEFLKNRFPILMRTATPIPDPATKRLRAIGVTDIGLNLQMVDTLLHSGKLDPAVRNLNSIETILLTFEKDHPTDARLEPSRIAIKQLRSMLARLEGNFNKMEQDLREQLQVRPVWPPEKRNLLKIPFAALSLPIAAVVGIDLPLFYDPVGAIRESLAGEAALYYELGMTALQAGDNKQARERFAMALKPQGVPLEQLNIGPESALAAYAGRYLALLERFAAEKPRR